ncbi:hypothetical protein CJ198_07735 [Brevibacterium luteolum]|uniref:Uncharacterized protein n=1 Tax=Brevibacterium luteolum TaxID=199591 RepID=A0A2N6PHU1_9MICO|nr:hypothetical protein CJ198_07735 [Brevibacterium luteolum]
MVNGKRPSADPAELLIPSPPAQQHELPLLLDIDRDTGRHQNSLVPFYDIDERAFSQVAEHGCLGVAQASALIIEILVFSA